MEAYGLGVGGHQPSGDWCARVVHQLPTPRGVVTSTTFFYFPEPDNSAPPFDQTPASVRSMCRAGFITIVADANADAPDARELTAALGRSSTARVMAPRIGMFPDGQLWRTGDVTIVAGRPSKPGASVIAAAHDRSHERLTLATRTTGAERRAWLAGQSRFTSRLNEAITLSDQPAASQQIALAFTAAYASDVDSPPPIQGATAIQYLDLVTSWVDRAKSQAPAARAASLLAADGLLTIGQPLWSADASARARLIERGASLFLYPLGGGAYGSRHAWLREAAAIAPTGRAQELIFLERMERGFELSGVCADQSGTGFRAVLREGMAYLAAHPDTAVAAEIHIMLGDAWADIVELASGGAYDESESRHYLPEKDNARTQALAEYRRAWTMNASMDHRTASWDTTWNLLAQLSPRRTVFYCVYD